MSDGWTRRSVVAGVGLTIAAAAAAAPGQSVVRVSGGLVAGTVLPRSGVRRWLGIPYARPPVGSLRWRPPQPVAPWRGVRAADRMSASPWASPADPGSVYYHVPSRMDEDCLTINVWAPGGVSARPRAVMVWIFGGAFVAGSSDYPLYDGAALARDGVVFVSFNYRVGILGFLAHPELAAESPHGVSGNYGLMDQIAALQWVRDNIAAFGGDPDNVTIMGQSAGAFSVGFHCVMPQSRGLFHRGIAQSGAPMGRPSGYILLGQRADMERAGLDFMREVGARDLAGLRALPPAALVEANARAWRFYPQIDGHLVPRHPFAMIAAGDHAGVPMIVGRNRDEGTMFPPLGDGTPAGLNAALDDVYGAQADAARIEFAARDVATAQHQGQRAFGDIVFNWNAAAFAVVLAKSGRARVFAYQFDYDGAVPPDRRFAEGQGRELGVFHGAEIGFALGTQAARGFGMNAGQARLLERMSGWWRAFAHNGNPDDASFWPAYRPGTATVLHIGADGADLRPMGDLARLALLGRAMGNTIVEQA